MEHEFSFLRIANGHICYLFMVWEGFGPFGEGFLRVLSRGRRSWSSRDFCLFRRFLLVRNGELRLTRSIPTGRLGFGAKFRHGCALAPLHCFRAIEVVDEDVAALAINSDRPVVRVVGALPVESEGERLEGVGIEVVRPKLSSAALFHKQLFVSSCRAWVDDVVLVLRDVFAACIGHGLRPPEVQGDPDLLLGLGVHDQLMNSAGSIAILNDGLLRVAFGNCPGAGGLVIVLEVVVELHGVGVVVRFDHSEAHLELVGGNVDVAVVLSVNVRDLGFDVWV